MKNNNIKIVLGIIIVIVLVFILSFVSFKVFSKKMPAIVSNLEISLTDSKKAVIVDDDGDFETANEVSPYAFQINNKGQVKSKYNIILEDNSKNTGSIPRNKLNYQLVLNGKVIKEGKLNELKNNILDTRVIESSIDNNYSLKIWVLNGYDVTSKEYNYTLKVVPIL